MQGYYAGHRTLPHFLDQDASGIFGTGDDDPPIRIVALGDSMMTGPGLIGPEDLWLRQIIDRLDHRIELKILGKGGAWTRDIRKNQLAEALLLRPDIAVVSGGSNDSVRGVSTRSIQRELQHVAGALLTMCSTVVLTGVGDMSTIPRLPQPLSAAAKWRSRSADRAHARVAAMDHRIVQLPMRDEGSQPFRERDDLFAKDLFHPNRDGHAVWADTGFPIIAAACRRVVEERR